MFIQMNKLIWSVLLAFSSVLGQACSLLKRDSCTPISAGNSSVDDVPAISKALSTCGAGGTIVIAAGKTFMIRTPLDFSNCSVCDFQIEGTLKVSDDLAYWGGRTSFFMLRNITGVTIRSVTGTGIIDGSGQAYWDYFASNRTYRRPSLLYLSDVSNVTFTNIQLKNAPNVFISVKDNSVNTKFSELILSAISTSDNQPLNTDGFNIGDSAYITLSNTQITNDDDCIAFQSGANYISVKNITCIGSHGLSLGSLGLFAGHTYEVKNVYVSDAKMINSTKAVGIKLYPGGSSHGSVFVSNITFERVTVNSCGYAFQVQSCYFSNKTTCEHNPSAATLSNINLIDFIGKTSNIYDPDVANINCPANGTCDLTFLGWNIVAPSGNSTVLCSNYDDPSGVKCTPGAFG
jgi:galacturan 1,4-alpha-galacturonidase